MDIHIAKVRAALPKRYAPYWRVVRRGCAIGVRRNRKGDDTWVGRYRLDGVKQFTKFGRTRVLTWEEALKQAEKWFKECEAGQKTSYVTVAEACRLYVDNRRVEKYDDIFSGKWVLDKDNLSQHWLGLSAGAKNMLPAPEANRVIKVLNNYHKVLDSPTISGGSVQRVDSALGKLSKNAYKQGDGMVGEFYSKARSSLNDAMPGPLAQRLKDNHAEYAAYKVLEDATSKAAPSKRSAPGTITPGELMTSAIKGNRSMAAQGLARRQNEAAQAARVLGDGPPAAGGMQQAAASITPAVVTGMGLMAPKTALMAGAICGLAVNPATQRALNSGGVEAGSILTGAAVGTQLPPARNARIPTVLEELEEIIRGMGL